MRKRLLWVAAAALFCRVPRHGPLSTKKDLTEMQTSVATFDAKAQEVVKAGASAEAIVAELKKILPARTQGAGMIGANVSGRYLGRIGHEKNAERVTEGVVQIPEGSS